MKPFEYVIPKEESEALKELQHKEAILKAGGVDLIDLLKEGTIAPKRLVSIHNLSGLSFVHKDDQDNLNVGANTTLAELSEAGKVPEQWQALSQAAAASATPQIRNMATLAGNLCQRTRCWYFRNEEFFCLQKGGNTCFARPGENQLHSILGNDHGCVSVNPSSLGVALLALDAKLQVHSAKGQREMTLADFFVPPQAGNMSGNSLQKGEMIRQVILPRTSNNFRSYYYKHKQKMSYDWPIAEVAVSFELANNVVENARVILGAAAPTPWRSHEAEEVLNGMKISKELAIAAAQEAIRPARPLSQNKYKLPVFESVITRTICWAAGIDPFAS